MARYFFDVIDGRAAQDAVELELPDLDAVRREAMRVLPEIAHDEFYRDGREAQTLAVLVTDEGGQPVYRANLSYDGIWLQR